VENRVLHRDETLLAKRVRLEKTILNIRKNNPVAFSETLQKEFKIYDDLILSDISVGNLQEIADSLKNKIPEEIFDDESSE
jgi:Ca2+-binding EF-hand superfamily protein